MAPVRFAAVGGAALALLAATLVALHSPAPAMAVGLRTHQEHAMVAASGVEHQGFPDFKLPDFKLRAPNVTAARDRVVDEAQALVEDFNKLSRPWQIFFGVLGLGAGLLLGLAGFRFLKAAVFLVPGFLAASVVFGILETTLAPDLSNRLRILYGVTTVAFILVGSLAVYFIKSAVFLLGACLGMMLALMLNPVALRFVWPSQPVLNLYLWMAIFGIITGLLMRCFARPILVFTTAAAGAVLTMLAVASFTGGLTLISNFEPSAPVPRDAYYYLFGYLVATVVFAILQYRFTMKNEKKEEEREDEYRPLMY